MFTDLEGSTRLVQALRSAYPALLDAHHEIVRTAVVDHGGRIEVTAGDGVFATFADPEGALSAAVEIQRRHTTRDWPGGVDVRVRIGVHTGLVTPAETGLTGVDLHRAARVSASAWGGEILVSATTQSLVGDALVDGMTLRDLGEHHLRDLDAPLRLFEVVAEGLPSGFPPPRTVERSRTTNLPERMTSFVGRVAEVAEISALLDSSRLVTLTGVGGVGKTRLALEVATARTSEHPDGVWFVELAPVGDPGLVVQALATVLGVRQQEGRPLLDTVVDAVERRSCLVLLDNCEHVIDASAEMVAVLLARCPEVRVLATSREGLAVPGESIRALRTLDVPGDDEDLDPSKIVAHEAVTLFLERARAADPSFDPGPTGLRRVVEVCRRLDGIPLAIELAASRVRSLDVEHLAERLDDRFRLLSGGARTAMPRQRTLEATLEWSHDLLRDDERILFRRLAAFAGGFTLEACETVCPDADLGSDEVTGLLEGLVDKSLVVIDRSDGAYRYRLLETIRDYARTKLVAAGELERLRDAHARWVLDFARIAAPHLRGPDQRRWLDAVETEHAEIRAALAWTLGSGDVATAQGIAVPLVWFWAKRGKTTESVDWYAKLHALVEESEEDPLPVLLAIGSAATPLPDDELPRGFSPEAAVELARRTGTPRDVGVALTNLAPRVAKGDVGRGLELLHEAVEVLRGLGPSPELGDALHQLATFLRVAGEGDAARAAAEEDHRNATEIGELWDVGWSLALLALLDRNDGDLESASAMLREARELFVRIGDGLGAGWADGALGIVALSGGDHTAAFALLLSALDVSRRLGLRTVSAEMATFLARATRLSGDLPGAAGWLAEVPGDAGLHIDASVVEETAALLAQTDPADAVRLLAAAAAWREQSGYPWQTHWALHLDPVVRGLREEMGSDAFAETWTEGEGLDLAAARDLGRRRLASGPPATPTPR